jgi:hypothetical protein
MIAKGKAVHVERLNESVEIRKCLEGRASEV